MTVLYGVLMFGGGKFFTPAIIDRFGPRGFTSIALFAQTLGLAVWGMGTYLLTQLESPDYLTENSQRFLCVVPLLSSTLRYVIWEIV